MQFYFNGTLLDTDEATIIALTYVANDLQKPESVQSSYSNTISIPDKANTRIALGYSHVLSSTGVLPYREGDVQVISDDGRELFPFAKGEITRYYQTATGNRFDILLTAGNLDVFAKLGDKSIQDLDFSEFNHIWNLTNTAVASPNTTNYTYPLLDRGKPLDLNGIDLWDVWPATFGKLVLDRLFSQNGFQYTGLNTELMQRIMIPSGKRYQYDENYTKARSIRAGLGAWRQAERRTNDEYSERVKFESVTDPTYWSGSENPFDVVNMQYVAPQPMRVNISVGVLVHMEIAIKGHQIAGRVDIMHNGVSLANTEVKTNDAVRQVISVSIPNVFLNTGDVLYAKYTFRKIGIFIPTVFSELYERDTSFGTYANYFEVTMLPEFPHGGEINLANWLPDIKQKDFLKFCLQLHAAMMQTDQYTQSVRISLFQDVENNTPMALDWSGKYIPETEELSYKFGDFARKNYLKWKEDDTVKAGYGDGVITIDNDNLPMENTMIEFPFAATQAGGSFALPSVQNYKEKEGSEPKAYEFKDVEARVLLQGSQMITYTLLDSDNANTQTVTAPRCYFDGFPVSLNIQDYIIPTYYGAYCSILTYSKYLKLKLNLKPTDVSEIDFARPIWIDQYGQYFYLNKVSEFTPGQETSVELARL